MFRRFRPKIRVYGNRRHGCSFKATINCLIWNDVELVGLQNFYLGFQNFENSQIFPKFSTFFSFSKFSEMFRILFFDRFWRFKKCFRVIFRVLWENWPKNMYRTSKSRIFLLDLFLPGDLRWPWPLLWSQSTVNYAYKCQRHYPCRLVGFVCA